MTVDPAVLQALADLIRDHIQDVPVDEEVEVRDFSSYAADSMRDIVKEIRTADLLPAVRAAAYRLAAREVATHRPGGTDHADA
jgi:hypothetical protein